MKNRYIAIMDRVLDAYTYEHILRYFNEVKRDRITEHGFPRLTANIGILIAHGRRLAYTDLFVEMMDYCCASFLKPTVPGVGNDFSVKEIIFCLLEVERANFIPKEKTEYWRSLLARIQPETCYNIFAHSREEDVHNWALFTAVSEHMRKAIGLEDTGEFVDLQLATQLRRLDENSMYKDNDCQEPHQPMVYDIVPRGLFSVLMHFGYHGEFYEAIDHCLRNTGLMTLQMQSVTGELPYGGRSNQFLHNESHLSIIMEYEASRYAKLGNIRLAGQFKTAANKALDNIERWLNREYLTHVKNNYPLETKYGCEDYAYFDKYMVTAASFLYVAYLMCDETIGESPLNEEAKAFSLSRHFHKTFLRNKNWFVEVDTNADYHYDASGIGRIHRAGAPSAICLSVPGSAEAAIHVPDQMKENFAIAPGLPAETGFTFASEPGVTYTKLAETAGTDSASACFLCDFGGKTANLSCQVNLDAVEVSASAQGAVALMLPAFAFDGSTATQITCNDNVLEIRYQDYICRYTATAPVLDTGKRGFNRNGEYRLFYVRAAEQVSVTVEIEPA